MARKTDNDQVNVDFSNFPELLTGLDEMVERDDTDRSKLIRKLIREEIARRQQLPLPTEKTEKKTSPRIRPAAQAVAA